VGESDPRHAFTGGNEFCYIIECHCRLNDTGGTSKTFLSGDAILIRNGLGGHREAVETTTKHCVIRQHREAQSDP